MGWTATTSRWPGPIRAGHLAPSHAGMDPPRTRPFQETPQISDSTTGSDRARPFQEAPQTSIENPICKSSSRISTRHLVFRKNPGEAMRNRLSISVGVLPTRNGVAPAQDWIEQRLQAAASTQFVSNTWRPHISDRIRLELLPPKKLPSNARSLFFCTSTSCTFIVNHFWGVLPKRSKLALAQNWLGQRLQAAAQTQSVPDTWRPQISESMTGSARNCPFQETPQTSVENPTCKSSSRVSTRHLLSLASRPLCTPRVC